MATKQKFIRSVSRSLEIDFFDGSIDSLFEKLSSIKADILRDHPDAFDIRIEAEQSWDTNYISVTYQRPENEAEIAKRKEKEAKARKAEAKRKKDKEEFERKEYERLHAKYG